MSTRTFRDSKKKGDEVDIAAQRFPHGFDAALPLSNASALWVLQKRIQAGQSDLDPAPPLAMDKEQISKIYAHLRKFKEGPDVDVVVARRTYLMAAYAHLELTQYEMAQLFSLQPQDSEEAIALLPSLERFGPDGDAEQRELFAELLIEVTKPF